MLGSSSEDEGKRRAKFREASQRVSTSSNGGLDNPNPLSLLLSIL